MIMRIEILNTEGDVVDTIIASEELAEGKYPGAWRLAEYQHPVPSSRDLILLTIERMERDQMMPTATRTFILAAMEREAATAGISLEVLTAKNKTYRLLKAFDNQIAALRAQT